MAYTNNCEEEKLKKEIEIYYNAKKTSIKVTGDIDIKNFKLANCDISKDDLGKKFLIWKKLLQLTLNLCNNYGTYKKLHVKNLDDESNKFLKHFYEECENGHMLRCRNEPSKDNILEALYFYVYFFLQLQAIGKPKMTFIINLSDIKECCFCNGPINGSQCCICNASLDEMAECIHKTVSNEIPNECSNVKHSCDGMESYLSNETHMVNGHTAIVSSQHEECIDIDNIHHGNAQISQNVPILPVEHVPTGGWQCQTCTALNTDQCLNCFACETKRQRDDRNLPIVCNVDEWVCTHCTARNKNTVEECSVCEIKRAADDGRLTRNTANDGNPVTKLEKWDCPKCSFKNDATNKRCTSCDQSWRCDWCSFANEGYQKQCKTCEKSFDCPSSNNFSGWVCSGKFCGKQNVNSLAYCQYCKVEKAFPLHRGAVVVQMKKGVSTNIWICAECSAFNNLKARHCKACKISRNEQGKRCCNVCNVINDESSNFCSTCNVSLKDQAEDEQW